MNLFYWSIRISILKKGFRNTMMFNLESYSLNTEDILHFTSVRTPQEITKKADVPSKITISVFLSGAGSTNE